jgi:hypothetical protein
VKLLQLALLVVLVGSLYAARMLLLVVSRSEISPLAYELAVVTKTDRLEVIQD